MTIANHGTAAVQLGTINKGGPEADDFTIDATACQDATLDPGATCAVSIVFDPAAEGTRTATLTIANDLPLGARVVHLTGTADPPDTSVGVGGITASPATVYPIRDGYKDTVTVHGILSEPVSAKLEVRNSTNHIVRTVDVGLVSGGDMWATWNGRTASGSVVPSGKYKIRAFYTDAANNVAATGWVSVAVSHKRLYFHTAVRYVYGSKFKARGWVSPGSVKPGMSKYTNGVRISSGGTLGGWAGVGYSFTIPGATAYQSLRFAVLGRSPNGTTAAIGIQNFRICTSWAVACFDSLGGAAPKYGWHGTGTTDVRPHRSGHTVRGVVYVYNDGFKVIYDIAKVRLTIKYGILK
jgi:hypothetical protein